jgi:hypothetical protein
MLESLEASLTQIERLIEDAREREGSVTHVSHDLPAEFSAAAPRRIAQLRARIGELAEHMHISRRRVSKRRTVRGMLTAQLVRVEDITPSRLRSYGELDADVANNLAPSLQGLRAELGELLALLENTP